MGQISAAMRAAGLSVLIAALGAACVSIPDSPRNLPGGGAVAGSAGSAGTAGDSGSGGSGGLPLPDSGVCPTGFKACGEQCVSETDPGFGCAGPSCDACPSATRALSHQCVAGACAVLQCEPGFGDCNDELADGCEHDVTSDPKNCGACGWDCFGSSCSVNQCAPQEIANGLVGAGEIVVDADTVYVAQVAQVGVYTMAKDGTVKQGPSLGYATSLAQDDTYLYITTDTAAYRWAKTGGPMEQLASGKFYAVDVDATDLWLATWDGTNGRLQRSSKTITESPETIDTINSRIRDVHVAGDTVYYSADTGHLRRYSKSGKSINESLDYQSKAWGVAVDGSSAYWRGGDAVLGAQLGSDEVVKEFTAQLDPRGLALADGHLFWTAGGGVVMGSLTTKLVRVLGSLPKDSRGLTVDDEFVYYTTYTPFGDDTGQAFRVRRPPP